MALSGLDIYKLLPKTNCKKCGSPTCLAFAMKLAMKKASIDECPDIQETAKSALEESSRPPIALIQLGLQDNKVEIGGETVLFRHEKTFYHQTAIAITVLDTLSESELKKRVKTINEICFERVGQAIGIDMIALVNASASAEKYIKALEILTADSNKPLILVCNDPKILEAALRICSDKKPLIYSADSNNLPEICKVVKNYNSVLAIKANGLEELEKLSQEASKSGISQLVLDPGTKNLRQLLNDFTQIRRLSLKRNLRAFGYPVISYIKALDKYSLLVDASTLISKYAGIIIMDSIEKDLLVSLITLRQNIYTDPQKPVTVEPKVYKFGSPDASSPLMVTTNFSLTFYTVAPEIEASAFSAYLLVTNSEGMSVLTAWAAEKFTPEIIADTMKKSELDKLVSHRKIIIPGYVSVLSGRLEELSGWKVLVGPKESSGIPKYLKEIWK